MESKKQYQQRKNKELKLEKADLESKLLKDDQDPKLSVLDRYVLERKKYPKR
jgi:hypothetical protein